MINNLHVKNLALIDEADVTFTPGLNILTGETGAGKSLIIGSIGLALGARADLSVLRSGAGSGSVELTLSTDSAETLDLLDEMGIDHDEDTILIRRRISESGSDCHINGHKVTLKELSRISSSMIDICGQRDFLTLLSDSSLREILDSAGGDELSQVLSDLKEKYTAYKDVLCKLGETVTDEAQLKRNLDLAEYEVNEIDSANLKSGEDEEVEASFRRANNISRISESLNTVNSIFTDDRGISSLLSTALKEIRSVSEYDDDLSGIESQLYDAESICSDLTHDISSYMDSLEYDPEEYAYLTSRLDLINHLKSKYGDSIDDIMKYREMRSEELDRMRNHDSYVEQLRADQKRLHDELLILCRKAHDLRQFAADALQKDLLRELKDMNFLTCELNVTVSADESSLSAVGYDKTDFMISLNPGEAMKPLSSVASGGELSRIMLALKCVSGLRGGLDTLIFDEIDTGISGMTSLKVGQKLHSIAASHQVICITHQAQVAARADTHFIISKEVHDNRTFTSVKALDHDGMIDELVRMAGADPASDAARSAAIELKGAVT